MLRDEALIERQMEAKRQEIQAYRCYREAVEQWRQNERQIRNLTKIRQLELCESMQVSG